MPRIIVTGGTGFIGKRLVEALGREGHEVIVLSRSPGERALPGGARAAAWDPSAAGDWFRNIDGSFAVIHLAGEPAIGSRWTESRKRKIFDSRVRSTQLLVEAMRSAGRKPSVFICASGVNYYGSPGEAAVDEDAPPGSDFLSKVTQAWEESAGAASEFAVRVVRMRLGIVFGRGGGALSEMVKPFKFFVGGPIGSGQQYVPWIHIDDVVNAIRRCMEDLAIHGPVNFVAPEPVRNRELARGIGAVLGRPCSIAVPYAALRLRFGEGAEPLVTSLRVIPGVLTRVGYVWHYPQLRGALQAALG